MQLGVGHRVDRRRDRGCFIGDAFARPGRGVAAVTFVATGGIYLTGSLALGLGRYLAANTSMINRFLHPGSQHDDMLETIPLYLITDEHTAVKGALSAAQGCAHLWALRS